MSPGIGSWIMLSSALFCIGLVGVMLRRNPIVILLSLEIMLNAGNLLLVAGSRYVGGNDGHVLALTVMGVAAAEVVVGLGLIVALARARRAARRRRAAEPARMNAADYGWLVLLTPLLGLGFNIAVGAERLPARRGLGRPRSRSWPGFVLSLLAFIDLLSRDDSQRAHRLDGLALALGRQLPGRRRASSSTRSRA